MSVYVQRSTEETEQEIVMQWARMRSVRWPELRLLHHIPNGGARRTREAARLKRMGVLAGVPDLHLPAARAGYHGLYIEMKYGDGKLSSSQKEFLTAAASERNYCTVCYTANDAIEVLSSYIKGKTFPNLSILKDGRKIGEVEKKQQSDAKTEKNI